MRMESTWDAAPAPSDEPGEGKGVEQPEDVAAALAKLLKKVEGDALDRPEVIAAAEASLEEERRRLDGSRSPNPRD